MNIIFILLRKSERYWFNKDYLKEEEVTVYSPWNTKGSVIIFTQQDQKKVYHF